jgi:tRNA threonylcarbamoyladenosine biosynthesis protein TsaB
MSTIAGLDTATDDVSVAVVRDGEVVYERLVPKPEGGRPRHAEALLVELESAVETSGGWDAIDLLAIGVGPGSFTGLRVGIATGRAIAQASDKPVVAVGTLAALAQGISESGSATGRPRLAVLDARRGQMFAALFGTDGAERWESFVAGPEELGERLRELAESPVAGGSGALRFRGELEAAGAEVLPDSDPAHRVWARHVCRLATDGTPSPPGAIQPIYLRPPDAQVWLSKDRGKH